MEMLQDLFICFVLLGVGVWVYRILKKGNLPPGPFGLPVVGYLPFLGTKNVHLKLQHLAKTYGPIFSIKLGPSLFIVLTNANVVREAFSKAELNTRLLLPFYDLLGISNPLFENGTIWHQHRKFLTQVFRKLGVGKSSMHDLISGEVQSFLETVSHVQGAPMDIRKPLSISLMNIGSCWMFGKKLSTTDQILLNKTIDRGVTYFQQMVKFSLFPWALHIPLIRRMNQQIIKNVQGLNKIFTDIFKKEINQQTASSEASEEPNYTNMYLTEMEIQSNDPENTLVEKSLFGSITNLYGASITVTLSTLEWCLYVVATSPEFQLKIHKEIDEVIGKEGTPRFADLKEMPFTHSFLMEVQRHYTVVPLTWPRKTSEELKIMNYTIPKGACVTACLYAVHHDPDYWDKPDGIIPERFLTPDRKSVKKPESHMPFSSGKRKCPGENLANMKIFYYFTSLLQKFELSLPVGETMDFEGVMNATFAPKNQHLCFRQRF